MARKLHISSFFSFRFPFFLFSLKTPRLVIMQSTAASCCSAQLGCSCPLSGSAVGFEEVLNLTV